MKIFENKSKLAVLAATPVLAIAFALAVGVFTNQAGATPAGNSNNAFAVGGITTLDGHVAFAAHLNPQNGNVNGHVVQDSMGVSRSGPVTCVTVMNSNMAVVVWTVNHSDNSLEIGQIRSFEVTDNGPPQMGVSPDLFCDRGCFNNSCTTFFGCGTMPVHGNIVVKGP